MCLLQEPCFYSENFFKLTFNLHKFVFPSESIQMLSYDKAVCLFYL